MVNKAYHFLVRHFPSLHFHILLFASIWSVIFRSVLAPPSLTIECYNVECCFDIVAVFSNNVEATFDFVAKNGNNVERVLR